LLHRIRRLNGLVDDEDRPLLAIWPSKMLTDL
jgi:hypothetical protein